MKVTACMKVTEIKFQIFKLQALYDIHWNCHQVGLTLSQNLPLSTKLQDHFIIYILKYSNNVILAGFYIISMC